MSSLDALDYPKESFHVVVVDCYVINGLDLFLKEHIKKYEFQASALNFLEQPVTELSWLITI